MVVKKVNEEKLRKKTVDLWNHKVLCDKPSKKEMRKLKKQIQHMKQFKNKLVEEQEEILNIEIEQKKEVGRLG